MKTTTNQLIQDAISVLDEPMTLRQLFYQLVSSGYPKTEEFYHKLGRAIGIARDEGIISWDLIVDTSRTILEPIIFDDKEQWWSTCLYSLKFPIWKDAPVVFIEKRALMGIIEPVLKKYRVTGIAISGYCSKTILNNYRDCNIVYMGDWDADGVCISDAARKYCPNLDRIALNEDQIGKYNLPTRPQKKTSKRAGNWGENAVELDALPKSILIDILECELESRIDPDYRSQVFAYEQQIKARVIDDA
jgi:hypothetical protein